MDATAHPAGAGGDVNCLQRIPSPENDLVSPEHHRLGVGIGDHAVLQVHPGVKRQRPRDPGHRIDVEIDHRCWSGLASLRPRSGGLHSERTFVQVSFSLVIEDDGEVLEAHGLHRMKAAGLVVAARTGDRTGCLRRDHREGTVREVGPGTSVAGPAHEGAPADVVDPASHRDAALGALDPLRPTLVGDPCRPERRGAQTLQNSALAVDRNDRHQRDDRAERDEDRRKDRQDDP